MTKLSRPVGVPARICQVSTQRRKVRSENLAGEFFSTRVGKVGGGDKNCTDKMSRQSDKEGRRIMGRQESCPLSTGQPNLTDRADS